MKPLAQKDLLKKGKFFLIAGPCVIESEAHALWMAREIKKIAERQGIPYVFKSSFDKANRSSHTSKRGPGIDEGLSILEKIRRDVGVHVTTDVHESADVVRVAQVVDIVQIPAFLSRQTDLLNAAARSGKIVNVKKGQFMAPWDAKNIVEKLRASNAKGIMLTERGASFGYNNLIVDMRAFPIMREFGVPIIYDATHSLQLPGGLGTSTAGMREFIPHLARAATATGIDGLFMEVHDNPEKAHSDASTQFPLKELSKLLSTLGAIQKAIS